MSEDEKTRPSFIAEGERAPVEPPVFCEQCPNLALALLDGSPLCRKCTLAAVEGRGPGWIRDHTRPLDLMPLAASVRAVDDSSDEVA